MASKMTYTDQLPSNECPRQLATVQTVSSVTTHPMADRLEIIRFNESHWQAVVSKNLCAVGEPVVVFEEDSVLTTELQTALQLPPRVKSAKIRNIVSQVCTAPYSTIYEYLGSTKSLSLYEDLGKALGVTKYCAPVSHKLAGDMAPNTEDLFALNIVPKTKQLRLQSYPELFDLVCSGDWYATLKLDGTSASYANYNGKQYVGSRNNFLTDEANAYYRYAVRTDLLEKLKAYDKNICIQGELVGPKIAGNQLQLTETSLYVFRIWDIDNQVPYTYNDLYNVCKHLSLDMVAYLLTDTGTHRYSSEDLIASANCQILKSGTVAEGIVVNSSDNRHSFKIINANYKQVGK